MPSKELDEKQFLDKEGLKVFQDNIMKHIDMRFDELRTQLNSMFIYDEIDEELDINDNF